MTNKETIESLKMEKLHYIYEHDSNGDVIGYRLPSDRKMFETLNELINKFNILVEVVAKNEK